MHAIIALQGALVSALDADAALVALIGNGAIFDAPPKGHTGACIAIARHDVLARDGDNAPGLEHRVMMHAWHDATSRKAVLAMVERVIVVALEAQLSGPDLVVTHAEHRRTDTMIDTKTGRARAAIGLRFFSEG